MRLVLVPHTCRLLATLSEPKQFVEMCKRSMDLEQGSCRERPYSRNRLFGTPAVCLIPDSPIQIVHIAPEGRPRGNCMALPLWGSLDLLGYLPIEQLGVLISVQVSIPSMQSVQMCHCRVIFRVRSLLSKGRTLCCDSPNSIGL